jgi:hypothetical protein
VTIAIRIGEIVIDGPALSHREREELQAFIEHDLAERIAHHRTGHIRGETGDPDVAPSPRSPTMANRGRDIAAGIASAVMASLPMWPDSGAATEPPRTGTPAGRPAAPAPAPVPDSVTR